MVPFYSLRFLWLPPPPPILYSFVVSRSCGYGQSGGMAEEITFKDFETA